MIKYSIRFNNCFNKLTNIIDLDTKSFIINLPESILQEIVSNYNKGLHTVEIVIDYKEKSIYDDLNKFSNILDIVSKHLYDDGYVMINTKKLPIGEIEEGLENRCIATYREYTDNEEIIILKLKGDK